MTRPHADRAKAVWTGTGTGTITLGGAAPGEAVQAIPAALDGQILRYLIKHEDAAEAEAGIGLYTHAGATLSRIYRTYPTLGGAAVSFSAGNKTVSLTNVHVDLVPNLATTDPVLTDDINSGYLEGHIWVNTTDNTAHICLHHEVGAAVWGPINNVLLDQYEILGRLASGTGVSTGLAAADLTGATPVSGDFLLGWTAAGLLRKYDIGALPPLAPTVVPSDAATFALADTLRVSRNVILTSHQASVVFEVPQAAAAGSQWLIMPVHDGCTVTINGAVGTLAPNPARMINGGLVVVTVLSNAGSAPVVGVRGEVIVPATAVTTKTYDTDDHGQTFEATGTQTFSTAAASIPNGYFVDIWNASGSGITIDGIDADHTLPANSRARVRKRADGALVCVGATATVLDAA